MRLEGFNRGVTFLLVSGCDDKDKRFVLGACLKKFIDYSRANAKPQAAANVSIDGAYET